MVSCSQVEGGSMLSGTTIKVIVLIFLIFSLMDNKLCRVEPQTFTRGLGSKF